MFYIVPVVFPAGSAGASRVLGIGRALRSAGWEVRFASGQADGRPADRQPDGSFKFDGFDYWPIGDADSVDRMLRARIKSYLRRGQRAICWLESQRPAFGDVVVAYNVMATQLARLRRWCAGRGVPLVVDCVEWYQPSHLHGGALGPLQLGEEIRMRVLNRRVDGLIAISRYLESYYSTGRLDVIRVPPLVDVADPKWTSAPTARRTTEPALLYAGVPGKKDLFGNLLRACDIATRAGARFRLVVAGPPRAEVERAVLREQIPQSALSDWIEAVGLVEQDAVPGLLASADFSLLARPRRRYAMAGFPTKVVESLAAGTPPLLNITSDLGDFIHDGYNGIVARDESAAEMAKAIQRAVSMGDEARRIMRARARETAEACFDYRLFAHSLGTFVARVAGRQSLAPV